MFRPTIFRLLNYSVAPKFICNPKPVTNCARSLIRENVFFNQNSTRCYAKGKNKIKEDKGKGKKKNIEINESSLGEEINVSKLKSELENSVSKMKDTYINQLSLRSSTGAIDNLTVKFEDKKYSLMELGQVIRKNPKTVIINMTDFPQAIPSVLKGIADSGMNLNPQQDGTSIFIAVPKVTKEYREGLAKNAKAHFIKCRDSIHDVQNKYLKYLKNKVKEGLSEDKSHQLSEQVKQMADIYIEKAEKLFELKQNELLGET